MSSPTDPAPTPGPESNAPSVSATSGAPKAEAGAGRILGDIGGTNIRLAWQDGPGQPLADLRRYRSDDFPGPEQALRHYLADTGRPLPAAVCLGIANPITGDTIHMTNHPWRFSVRQVQAALGLRRLLFINDFAALALSLPDLGPAQLRAIGGGASVEGEPRALIGPGTGLGMSTLLRFDGRWHALAGEGGHATLPARTELEWALVQRLAARHGHVSAERVLSGPGLKDLHAALRDLRNAGGPDLDAAAISQAALAGEPLAAEALGLFCAFLGTVAGDLALTVGARGGVYLGGGILPRILPFLRASAFRERFEDKGRFRDLLASIPAWVIDADVSPALWGAARALDQA